MTAPVSPPTVPADPAVAEPVVLPRDPNLVTLASIAGVLLPPHG
jgi:hypothetical protein